MEKKFLYRPARKAGRNQNYEPTEAIVFLYRPARKAGRRRSSNYLSEICFYTDLPVRQVFRGYDDYKV